MAEARRRRSIPVGRAKPIMIQGTMSNAGKSLLAAGLCRVLSQDGLRVAPFKSQNMALNSGVTADGLEMGRAQIMQAEACGIAPDVRMNPILLKPESDHRSQLIVAGKAQGAFAARDYFVRKKALMPQILKAFDSLAEENDVIVIEGAGSPVEINLAETTSSTWGSHALCPLPCCSRATSTQAGCLPSSTARSRSLRPRTARFCGGLW